MLLSGFFNMHVVVNLLLIHCAFHSESKTFLFFNYVNTITYSIYWLNALTSLCSGSYFEKFNFLKIAYISVLSCLLLITTRVNFVRSMHVITFFIRRHSQFCIFLKVTPFEWPCVAKCMVKVQYFIFSDLIKICFYVFTRNSTQIRYIIWKFLFHYQE